MGIVYKSSASDGGSGTTLTMSSVSVPSGSTKLLVAHVAVRADSTGDSVGVTDAKFDGVSGTLGGTAIETTGQDIRISSYYWLNANLPSSGTADLVFTIDDAQTHSNFGYEFLDGVKQQAPEATATASVIDTNSVNASVTSITNNAWAITGVSWTHGTGSLSPQDSQIERMEEHSWCAFAAGDIEIATAGAQDLQWDNTNNTDAVAVSLVFEEAAAGSGPVTERTISSNIDLDGGVVVDAAAIVVDAWLQDARVASGDDTGDKATYTFTLDKPAQKVSIFSWWPSGNYATNTPYIVTLPGQSPITYLVDQSTRGAQLNFIQSISGYIAAGDIIVEIGDDANGVVVADMVRLEVEYTTPPRTLVDISDDNKMQRHFVRRMSTEDI